MPCGSLFLTILYEKNTPTTTFPFFPLWTLFFNTGHQGRVKIRLQVIVNDRIFLTTPIGNHDPVLWSGPDNAAVGAG